MDKFILFLESLKDSSNEQLIHLIKEGYNLIYESLSTDDANEKPDGQTVTHISPASVVNYLQNKNNEYFPQTLSNKDTLIVEKATFGKRIATYPTSGRTSTGKDSLNQHQSTYNVNGVGGEYAGGGTGYNLGTP